MPINDELHGQHFHDDLHIAVTVYGTSSCPIRQLYKPVRANCNGELRNGGLELLYIVDAKQRAQQPSPVLGNCYVRTSGRAHE